MMAVETEPLDDKPTEAGESVQIFPQHTSGRNDPLAACLIDRDMLARIIECVSDGILAVDQAMRVTSLNQAGSAITGVSKEKALGKACGDIFRQILCSQECVVCQGIQKGIYLREAERLIVREGGERRLVLVTTTPLTNQKGARDGLVVVFRDIQEIRNLRDQLTNRFYFHKLIGKNHSMRNIYRLIEQVADSTASVLIQGESGTGKELVAHAIHYQSPRAGGPFVTVNCSALVETLLESELFGHVKGAFTGATYSKVGRFELADGGTIFLDEIGDISPMVQLKLLRVLQEKQFEPVGESKSRTVEVRVVAASNKDLRELVRGGHFRDDLYYRLKVVAIDLPPLRERKDDIPLLTQHFVEKLCHETGKNVVGPTKEAMAALLTHPWPGNVRELGNALEHAFVLCRGDWLTLEDLPPEIKEGKSPALTNVRDSSTEEEEERLRIAEALKSVKGRPSEAARQLGMSRTTLWRKLKKHQISRYETTETDETF